MENQETSLFAFAMKYGIVGGLVVIALTLLFFLLDMSTSPIPQLISYGVILAIILWGQWEYKKQEQGPIFYSEALGLGILIILYFDLLVTCYLILHLSFIDTELIQNSLAMAEETLRQSGMPADQVDNAIQMQEMMSGPVVTPLISFIPVMILGVLLSLITAIFMRRKPA